MVLALAADGLHQLGESSGIVDSDVGEHLAVDGDVLLLETIHQHGVAHVVHAGSRIDAGDPQTTEITLAQATAHIGVTKAAGDLLAGSAVLLGLGAETALGKLKHLAAFLMGINSCFDTCHILYPP